MNLFLVLFALGLTPAAWVPPSDECEVGRRRAMARYNEVTQARREAIDRVGDKYHRDIMELTTGGSSGCRTRMPGRTQHSFG